MTDYTHGLEETLAAIDRVLDYTPSMSEPAARAVHELVGLILVRVANVLADGDGRVPALAPVLVPGVGPVLPGSSHALAA